MSKNQVSPPDRQLEEKIERIRLQNEKIKQRYKEVEADKQTATNQNAMVNVLARSDEDWTSLHKTETLNRSDPEKRSRRGDSHEPSTAGSSEPPDRGRGRSAGPRTSRGRGVVATERHSEWLREREKYDQERINRQKTPDGQWRREWDNEKIPQQQFQDAKCPPPSYQNSSGANTDSQRGSRDSCVFKPRRPQGHPVGKNAHIEERCRGPPTKPHFVRDAVQGDEKKSSQSQRLVQPLPRNERLPPRRQLPARNVLPLSDQPKGYPSPPFVQSLPRPPSPPLDLTSDARILTGLEPRSVLDERSKLDYLVHMDVRLVPSASRIPQMNILPGSHATLLTTSLSGSESDESWEDVTSSNENLGDIDRGLLKDLSTLPTETPLTPVKRISNIQIKVDCKTNVRAAFEVPDDGSAVNESTTDKLDGRITDVEDLPDLKTHHTPEVIELKSNHIKETDQNKDILQQGNCYGSDLEGKGGSTYSIADSTVNVIEVTMKQPDGIDGEKNEANDVQD